MDEGAAYAQPVAIPAGSRVVVVVSRGPRPSQPIGYAEVPDVRDEVQGSALSRLQGAGLQARVFNDYSDGIARGRVMGQLPSAGEGVAADSDVVLLVSSGRPPTPAVAVRLPDVLGKSEAQAVSELQAAGFSPQIAFEYSPSVPAGVVLAQLPDRRWAAARPRPTSPWIWVAVALGAVALMAVAGWLLLLPLQGPGTTVVTVEPTRTTSSTVTVPDLGGLTRADAEADLARVGLEAQVRTEVTDQVAPGRVVSQSPAAGDTVGAGTTVGVVIAEGEPAVEEVTVPALLGLAQEDAERTVRNLGVEPIAVDNADADAAAGVVSAQWPAEGERVTPGQPIAIQVSIGPATGDLFGVPDLTGAALVDAQGLLAEVGLQSRPLAVVNEEFGVGQVWAQLPEAGAELPADGTVLVIHSTQ